jgi:hypothetical protein
MAGSSEFIRPPPGSPDYEDKHVVYEVLRPLYGAPSSPQALHKTLDGYFKSVGFTHVSRQRVRRIPSVSSAPLVSGIPPLLSRHLSRGNALWWQTAPPWDQLIQPSTTGTTVLLGQLQGYYCTWYR